MHWRRFILLSIATLLPFAGIRDARAIEVEVSAQALERTLRAQLFNAPQGRYYIRGGANSACFVYAEDPHVSFDKERIVIHVHTRARLGTAVHGTCLGVSLSTEADVSVIPQAEEESIGFRDARIEHLSESRELNLFLIPFLSRKLPTEMKLDAAMLIRQLLTRSADVTGYALKLDALKLHSLLVEGQSLSLDMDGTVHVD